MSSVKPFTLGLALLSLLALLGGDWQLTATDASAEWSRFLQGLVLPDFAAIEHPLDALLTTVAIALLGVILGVVLAIALLPIYHWAPIRWLCTATRSVHELFWAMLFLQLFGLSTLTALLALALPYGATFARIYHDILQQAPKAVRQALAPGTGWLMTLLYGQILPVWPQLVSYTRYRFECALRASAVLGFVGLPTLGFHLETAYRQGQYAEGGALLWMLFVMIGTQNLWLRRWSWPLLALLSLLWLPWSLHFEPAWAWQFVSQEIWPQTQYSNDSLWQWLQLWGPEALHGLWGTLMMALMALALSAVLCLLLWPFATPRLFPRARWLGHGVLLVGRSLPELLLAFLLLMLLGPSMLPAALALALHNGTLIAHLLAQRAQDLPQRLDNGTTPSDWLYHYLPRLYPGARDLLTYRFEIMVRETAMLGMLGVASLGFYVDSAFELFHFDIAFALILVTATLNLTIAALCRWALYRGD
ncbi:hypothetical protein [Ferrimonas marina]|uniref:Phosphonate transport system permease protein n=1 Tax=Ferrimonas marina TaxID=299255 RepID=A0A1M5S8X7_9GAMM|nr:hypothetical protein [Ferrimonas marina]SHH34956.1 phosphonate transport system permease protein [Ferrimonas marina]